MNYLVFILSIFITLGCATNIPNNNLVGQDFPPVKANNSTGESISVLDISKEKNIVLIIGMVQRAQKDMDLWREAITKKNKEVPVVEIMILNSWLPNVQAKKMSKNISAGSFIGNVRKLVTAEYDESKKIRVALGEGNPESAHVLILNEKRVVIFQHDVGYSEEALNKLLSFKFK